MNWYSDDNKFLNLLKSRKFEHSGADLAERIIFAARAIKQKENFTFYSFFENLFSGIIMPKIAAAALASLLALGVFIGMNDNDQSDRQITTSVANLQEIMYEDSDAL